MRGVGNGTPFHLYTERFREAASITCFCLLPATNWSPETTKNLDGRSLRPGPFSLPPGQVGQVDHRPGNGSWEALNYPLWIVQEGYIKVVMQGGAGDDQIANLDFSA